MRSNRNFPLLPRGVRQAPWFGPNGELVLVAITAKHIKWKEVTVPHGASRVGAGEALQAELDLYDPPPPNLRVMRA